MRNWGTFEALVSLQWQGQMGLVLRDAPVGGASYLPSYLLFMGVLCVFPYFEEFVRCVRKQKESS